MSYVITQKEFDRAVQAERRRQVEMGYDAAHDDAHGLEHLRQWELVYAARGELIKSRAIGEAIKEHIARNERRVCTCPSGDGSLRWPCPVHPPADVEIRRQS